MKWISRLMFKDSRRWWQPVRGQRWVQSESTDHDLERGSSWGKKPGRQTQESLFPEIKLPQPSRFEHWNSQFSPSCKKYIAKVIKLELMNCITYINKWVKVVHVRCGWLSGEILGFKKERSCSCNGEARSEKCHWLRFNQQSVDRETWAGIVHRYHGHKIDF